MGRKY
jgi:hypothetical protein